MKYISKKGAPKEYSDWCRLMRGKENEDYRELDKKPKDKLFERLLNEQGWICGYTMKRIDKDEAHIEHIKPETVCRVEKRGSDLDYRNMIACFPREGMRRTLRYGAQQKDKWWKNEGRDFLSPLNTKCETFITFNLNGEVKPYNYNAKAKETIDVLKLDNDSLTDERRQVIETFIYSESGRHPISKNQAQSAIKEITKRDGDGKFYVFCMAIKHALREYVEKLENETRKQKFAAREKKKKK